jgi:hypothetical protein
MLDQQFGEDPHLSRGILSRRTDDKQGGLGGRIACHHGNQGSGRQFVFGDAEPRKEDRNVRPDVPDAQRGCRRYRGQISEGTLCNWRSMRICPSFIKIGKAILYPLEELDRWDRRNLVVCRPSHRSHWRKRWSDMCLIRQLALSGMIQPRWISIRNPC